MRQSSESRIIGKRHFSGQEKHGEIKSEDLVASRGLFSSGSPDNSKKNGDGYGVVFE